MKRLLVFLLFVCSPLFADTPTDFIRYEAIPELGIINIENYFTLGEKPYEYSKANVKGLTKKGIFPFVGDKEVTYTREDVIEGKQIKTEIELRPPVGTGYGGGNYHSWVSLFVNDKKLIDVPIGYHAGNDIWMYRISYIAKGDEIRFVAMTEDGYMIDIPDYRAKIKPNKSFFNDWGIEKYRRISKSNVKKLIMD